MNLGGNMKWVLLVGGILLCAVCAIVATGGNLLGGLGGNSPVVVDTAPNSGVPIDQPISGAAKLSQIVMARNVGEGNVPLDQTNQFTTSDTLIYAVAQGNIPSGTRVFARWSRDGSAFEDTNEIVSDRDYADTYIEFHISPDGKALTPGSYTVQFYVNGNPGPQAQFTIV